MTEIVQYQEPSALTVQMDYARAVSTASMLPDSYRGKPADIMLAVGLGQSMGLSPAESLYRIAVIKGKPTASAELIAANVRKAGHRLRVATDEAAQSVTATIFRADDPDFPFEVTRDMAWAKSMGLATNDNYRKQALTMLQWRAITACARVACPEALYGVSHTPDEMADFDSPAAAPQATSGADRMRQVLKVEQITSDAGAPTPTAGTGEDESGPSASASEFEPITKRTRGQLFALFAQKGVTEEEQLSGANHVLGKEYESRSQFTEADGLQLIEVLKTRPDVDVPMVGSES